MAPFPKPIPGYDYHSDPEAGILTVQKGHDPTRPGRDARNVDLLSAPLNEHEPLEMVELEGE